MIPNNMSVFFFFVGPNNMSCFVVIYSSERIKWSEKQSLGLLSTA